MWNYGGDNFDFDFNSNVNDPSKELKGRVYSSSKLSAYFNSKLLRKREC